MISFEKPSSVKKFSQDLLAEVKHRNQYGACELINVLKHGVYRFVFTSTSRHCCPRTPEINSKNKTERKETKSPQPTPPDRHCRWAISNNKIQLKSETKSLHDEKAPTLDQPTVEKSLKKKVSFSKGLESLCVSETSICFSLQVVEMHPKLLGIPCMDKNEEKGSQDCKSLAQNSPSRCMCISLTKGTHLVSCQ